MALSEGYGVLAGVPEGHGLERGRPGELRHHHLLLRARAKLWDVAINTGEPKGESALLITHVEGLPADAFADVLGMGEGFHALAPEPASGALDVVRHPALRTAVSSRWSPAHGAAVGNTLRRSLGGCARILAFGEPFRRRRGLHNVHCNQGDPPGSPWAHENGPWQDGGLLFVPAQAGEPVALLLLRFASQRLEPGGSS